jgi:hypothetical protein
LNYSKEFQRVFRWTFFPLLGLPPTVFIAVAMLAPSDVLQVWPWAKSLVTITQHATHQALPWIDFFRHAKSTEFSQVASLASAIGFWWCLLLVATVFAISVLGLSHGRQHYRQYHTRRQLLALVAVAPLLALLTFFGFFGLSGDPSFATGLTVSSRVGYAAMGAGCILFSGAVIGMWPICVLALIDSVLEGSSRD